MPARCERARQWASLEVDDALSPFEGVILARHLRSCGQCRAFADAVATQTRALRAARLEEPTRLIIPQRAPSRRRSARLAVGALVMAASAAAAVVLGSQANPASQSARRVESGPMFVVVAATPRPGDGDLTVPRLKARSVTADDGPVHGYLSTPA